VSPTASGLLFSSRFYFYPGQVTEDWQGDFFVTGASGATMLTVHPFQATSKNGGPVLAKLAPNLAPAPLLTSITPVAGPTDGGTLITLTGAQFDSLADVSLDGMATTDVQFLSSTELSAVTRPHAPGAVNVTVTNGDGQTVSLIEAYTYQAEIPDSGADAGSKDAGPRSDGGPAQTGTLASSGGCGCMASSAAPGAWWALMGLIVLARWRRRAS
jgi:MYXO-CTERM domain-containing protein